MQIKLVAELIGTSPDTVRRYASEVQAFLSPSATPGKGKTRNFTPHDVNVLAYVVTLKQQNLSNEEITERLVDHKAQGWVNLPMVELPDDPGQTMPITEAASRAYDMAQAAVLARELEYTRAELLQAQKRVDALQSKLEQITQDAGAKDDAIHQLELQLEQAKGRVAALESELTTTIRSYSLVGRQVGPVALVGIVLVVALVLVVILLVIARLI